MAKSIREEKASRKLQCEVIDSGIGTGTCGWDEQRALIKGKTWNTSGVNQMNRGEGGALRQRTHYW